MGWHIARSNVPQLAGLPLLESHLKAITKFVLDAAAPPVPIILCRSE
jgi:hypothetical protein